MTNPDIEFLYDKLKASLAEQINEYSLDGDEFRVHCRILEAAEAIVEDIYEKLINITGT